LMEKVKAKEKEKGSKITNEEDDSSSDQEKPLDSAIKGINFSIKVGTTTALVGRSGAGKSTLANLLLRLYAPTGGAIYWDNKDITQVTAASLRRLIAVVPQETSLFNRTIRENIAYSKPDASMEEIIDAAQRAHAHDFIMKTPEGYESVIGERGVQLSGGQRQRVAIARALLMNPSVLVLDESTSHLDSESEQAIQQAISSLRSSEVTQVIIAHRLSTIVKSDLIVVLDEGRVVDMGSHDHLISHCSLYEKFCSLQFKNIDSLEPDSETTAC